MGLVYLNFQLLIPRLLRQGRYTIYVIWVIVFIAFFAWLHLLLFDYWIDYIFPGYYFISYYNFWQITLFHLSFWVLTTLLKLSKAWFMVLETQNRLHQLEKEKLDTELQALKSQINPHFLFNSLNNVYALALDRDPGTPEVILRLSAIMRYMLYESNEPSVALTKELQYIEDYVAMQKLRLPAEAAVRMSVSGDEGALRIAPLLLLPLVENAFKHGAKGATKAPFVDITIKIEGNQMTVNINNNKGIVDEVEQGRYGGLGLQNVRRRLQLLYPDRHELVINEQADMFGVSLKIEL